MDPTMYLTMDSTMDQQSTMVQRWINEDNGSTTKNDHARWEECNIQGRACILKEQVRSTVYYIQNISNVYTPLPYSPSWLICVFSSLTSLAYALANEIGFVDPSRTQHLRYLPFVQLLSAPLHYQNSHLHQLQVPTTNVTVSLMVKLFSCSTPLADASKSFCIIAILS